MGLLSILFPPPASLPELVRRHDLPALVKAANREAHHCEGGAGGFLNKPVDGDGNTPLILAAGCGAYRIVDWIVAQPGVELDLRNRCVLGVAVPGLVGGWLMDGGGGTKAMDHGSDPSHDTRTH